MYANPILTASAIKTLNTNFVIFGPYRGQQDHEVRKSCSVFNILFNRFSKVGLNIIFFPLNLPSKVLLFFQITNV